MESGSGGSGSPPASARPGLRKPAILDAGPLIEPAGLIQTIFRLTVQPENNLTLLSDHMIHTLCANSASFGRRTFRSARSSANRGKLCCGVLSCGRTNQGIGDGGQQRLQFDRLCDVAVHAGRQACGDILG
jgi:hypothetical protein